MSRLRGPVEKETANNNKVLAEEAYSDTSRWSHGHQRSDFKKIPGAAHAIMRKSETHSDTSRWSQLFNQGSNLENGSVGRQNDDKGQEFKKSEVKDRCQDQQGEACGASEVAGEVNSQVGNPLIAEDEESRKEVAESVNGMNECEYAARSAEIKDFSRI